MRCGRKSGLLRFLEALLLLFCLSVPARADDRVIVVVAPQTDPALDAVVRERVAAAGASLELEHAPVVAPLEALASAKLPAALAHVWIDFTKSPAVLVLLDAKLERGLLRRASRARGDEIAREEIGHVLETAIEGLLAGMTIGIDREDLLGRPPSKKTTSEAAIARSTPMPLEPASPWHVRSGGLYGIDAFGAGTAIHGPGVTLDVLHRIGLGGRILAQARFPAQIAVSPITLRLESWAVRGGALGVLRFGAWSLEALLGAGFDVEHVVPTATSSGGIARSSLRVSPLLRASIALAFGAPRVALAFGLDVDLGNTAFESASGPMRATLFSSNVARPGVVVEIGTP
jgi:hypothetical protein